MPRKARKLKRPTVAPDPKFGNVKYGKFINYLMQRGKKSVAQRIFYTSLELIGEKMKNNEQGHDSKQIFDIALKNITPLVEVKGRRIGGANYQVPTEVVEPRKTALGMKWLIAAAQSRKGAPMHEKLAAEVMDAYNKMGAAMKKRDDTHRMAEANKAFAHFAKFQRR